jgi:hypothetical protein
VLLAGCDLFKPAIPDSPTTSGLHVSYGSPDQTLDAVAKGVQAKGGGQAAYTQAFADSTVDGAPYYATFDPEVVRRYESTGRRVPTWNIGLEQDFFLRLAGLRNESYSMQWTHDDDLLTDERGDQTAKLYRRYRIFAIASDGTAVGLVALGLADLSFQKTAPGRWALVRWDDHVDLNPITNVGSDDRYNLTMGARRLGIQ